MKSLIQLIVAIILVITTLYANTTTYNRSDKAQDTEDFVRDFSVSKLVEEEIKAIEQNEIEREMEEIARQEVEKERIKNLVSRGSDRGVFTATAYDLTVASCGKKQSHPAYGITANGTSLKGHTLESARAVAVDPKVIKLGSKIYIEFLDEEYQHLNGEYIAVDTGRLIKGKRVDIFFGDTGDSKTDQAVWDFGKRKIKVTVLPNDE